MKKLLLLATLLFAFCFTAQAQYTHAKGSLAGPTTVSALPLIGSSNILWDVRDANSASDCTAGGGSTRVVCKWNGATYAAVGGSGGGGITCAACTTNTLIKFNGSNGANSRITDDGTDQTITNLNGSFDVGDPAFGGNGTVLHLKDVTAPIFTVDVNANNPNYSRLQMDATSGFILRAADATHDVFIASTVGSGTLNIVTGAQTLFLDADNKTLTATADPSTGVINLTASAVNTHGTITNDSAASGYVGEYLTAALASGDATSLSTGTAKTIISVSLTAGDWDVWGIADYIPAATTTTAVITQGASATDNTLGAAGTFTALSGGNLTGTVLGSLLAAPAPMQRISLASTTTIYLVGKATFAVSTMTVYGSIFARRVR